MIPALEPLFIGEFAGYREALILKDDSTPCLPMSELLKPDCLDQQLARFAMQYGAGDRRGLASMWTKHYFVRLIPPVVAASLILDWQVPVTLDRVAVVLDEQAKPLAFRLPHAGHSYQTAYADPFARFDDLVEGHLRPFIETVASHVRISPKVLWSNAGNYLEWLLGVLAAAMPDANLADGHALLAAKNTPDGRRNPLFQPVRYVQVQGQSDMKRQRRVCCVRYRVGGLAYCGNCPLAKLTSD
ncbi:siderophore-iron reductase FhuF [Pseudomonas huanghezhanensis]|uniref:siderophore-iron reductase FhuF n=1 Tax=Pseudomonas huanghezhanensis TaxID=3002903 RepID=UPI002285A430|nr:siderophore-iron reductase FhuF [Pseudomonas sp. BSw22131]